MKTIRAVTPLTQGPDRVRPENRDQENGQAAQKKDRAYFRGEIHIRWNQAVESILDVCNLLIEAESTLSKTEFAELIKDDVPFDYSTVRKLITIGRDQRIIDLHQKRLLPASYNTLYELTRLSDEEIRAGVNDERIGPGSQWKDVRRLRKELHPKPNGKAAGAEGQVGSNRVESTPVKVTVTDMPAPVSSAANASVDPEWEVLASGDKPKECLLGEVGAHCRIVVYIRQRTIQENPEELSALKEEIELLARKYAFVESVAVENAILARGTVEAVAEAAPTVEAEAEYPPTMTQRDCPDSRCQVHGHGEQGDGVVQPDSAGRNADFSEADQLAGAKSDGSGIEPCILTDKARNPRKTQSSGPVLTTDEMFRVVRKTSKKSGSAKAPTKLGLTKGRRTGHAEAE